MTPEVFQLLSPGLGATLQDQGRFGWRRFGVPPSGAMDDHAAGWANRLLDNPFNAPVLELLGTGVALLARQEVWIAVTGADVQANVPLWQALRIRAGQLVHLAQPRAGLWVYVAVEGGFESPRLLGSASVYPRGNLGRPLARGDILCRAAGPGFQLPPSVAGRMVAWSERRDYSDPPALRVWPGPQWEAFSESDRDLFFGEEWTVTSQIDRVGYRLTGPALKPALGQIISEPVEVGSVQVPENGQPIVTMRDGPTAGGYPKLGLVDPADLSWLAQCQPGQTVQFQPVTAADAGPEEAPAWGLG